MTTFDPNTATLQELRDYIAERKGWKRVDTSFGKAWNHPCLEDISTGWGHPIGATLDAANASMPEGWGALSINHNITPRGSPPYPWTCQLYRFSDMTDVVGWGDTELLARFRAACFAWIEEEKR